MELEINIPNVLYKCELWSENDDEKIRSESHLVGEVMLTEKDMSMNLLYEGDREELLSRINSAIEDFIVQKLIQQES